MCRKTVLVMEDLCPISAFESSHSLHLEVYKLLMNYLIQYLLSKKPFQSTSWTASRAETSEFAQNVSVQSMQPYSDARYALRGVHVNFARREKTASLNGLFTGSELQGMLDAKN